ncbi:helix-turn-helix transcriptional regulator [Streptomyces sp. Ru87]|uniref:Response regulator transcription factor n=1 Tax=Streptomyces lycii TaxID=2654337 RepID=A0ABQ7FCA9_9ACTN|nr:response regulator transcription factor [Streptomyces lycii]PGH50613.1 helix-turn-helix transcriptional regulator [Streptomyces sp. Ru87]
MRSALAALLGKEGDFDVASATWETIALWARSLRPEVFVVDADDPSPGGAPPAEERVGTLKGAVRNAACGASLLALVSPGCPGLRRAFDAGALGFVNKNSTPQRLVEGVRKVSRGERFVDESLAFGFLEAAKMPLTPRELSVLSLAAGGAPISEIAENLHLCKGTVRNYMAAVIRKTGARNRVDAIRISQGAGWV